MATYNAQGNKIVELYYNCRDYGVNPNNADNTAAMQALIDLVYANGGGIIWVPIGTYVFDSEASAWNLNGNMTILCNAKKGVSIIGESLDRSVFKVIGNTANGAAMFGQHSETAGELLTGCTYSNFSVDMSKASLTNYTHRGKAFYFSGVKDCVFRDLRLIGTPSTSLGIDMLDNVVMDSIYVYQGGRQWVENGSGGAGIGIGTGKWSSENYVIRNCVCDSCGHYGIFLEDQGIFSNPAVQNYTKGQIITNNVVRNGRYYGIGVRGGKNIVVTSNNLYENIGGIYFDYGAKNVMVSNNIVQGSTEAGLLFSNDDATTSEHLTETIACDSIIVTGNGFFENAVGIKKETAPTNSQIANNIFVGNTTDEA